LLSLAEIRDEIERLGRLDGAWAERQPEHLAAVLRAHPFRDVP
jgi:hypothetical protein